MTAAQPALAAPPEFRTRLIETWRVSYPIIAGNLATLLLGVVDAAFQGHYSTDAIAAVAIALPVFTVANMLTTGWASAAQILVARRFGAGDAAAIGRLMDFGLAFSVAVGLFVSLALLLLAEPILRLMSGGPPLPGATAYLTIVAFSLPFSGVMAMCRAAYSGLGATRVIMHAAILVNLANIPLDYALVFQFDMGAAGSAAGTLIAMVAGAAYLLWFGVRRFRVEYPFLHRRDVGELKEVAPSFLRIGWPETAMLALGYLSGVVLARFAASIGVEELAGYRVLLTMTSIAWMVIWGASSGIAILAGQRLGAQDVPGAIEYQRAGLVLMASVTFLISLPAIVAPGLVHSLFSPDAAVQAATQDAHYLALAQFPLMVLSMTLVGVLRAGGETRSVMAASMIADYACFVPLAWLFALQLGLGLPGIYAGALLGWVTRVAVNYFNYRREGWKTARS